MAACSGPTEGGSDPTLPAGFAVPEPGSYRMLDESDVLSPTLEFMTQGMRDSEFFDSIEAAAASCMQLRGWTYEPVFLYQVDQPRTVGEARAFAEDYGYGYFYPPPAPDSSAQTEAIRRNHARFVALSPGDQWQYVTDYDGGVGEGTPTPDSCLGLAQADSGSIMYHPAAQAEMVAIGSAAWVTPEGSAVNRAYANCMMLRGHEFELPGYATLFVMELHERYQRGAIGFEEGASQEIQIAIDSFECELETRLPWIHHLRLEMLQAIVERYPELAREP